jgi:hypothetical protein
MQKKISNPADGTNPVPFIQESHLLQPVKSGCSCKPAIQDCQLASEEGMHLPA